jgi:hypothetical protein
LALHPDGITDAELGEEIYSSVPKSVTIRAELSRLRKLLGPVVTAPPYRLAADVHADFLEVERLLAEDDHAAALERYVGPLLPGSAAPGVVAARERLAAAVAAGASAPVGH